MARKTLTISSQARRKNWTTRRVQFERDLQNIEDNFVQLFATPVTSVPTLETPEGWYINTTTGDTYLRLGTALFTYESTVYDPAAPTLVSATIGTDGAFVTLVFSEALSGLSTGWTLTRGEDEITTTYGAGADTDTLILELSDIVYDGDTVTISYDAPTGGLATSPYRKPLEAITDHVVVNSSTEVEE